MIKIKNRIKLIISDFDGIFTDGKVIVNQDGSTSKKLSFLDIMGVSLLIKNGYKVAIISGDKSTAIDYLANKFDMEDVHQDIRIKEPIVKSLMKKYSLNPSEVAYIGDDFNDIDALNSVENRFTVPNANFRVKNVENIQVTEAQGGNGAFRELADAILF